MNENARILAGLSLISPSQKLLPKEEMEGSIDNVGHMIGPPIISIVARACRTKIVPWLHESHSSAPHLTSFACVIIETKL